jgi:hypothetical protein
MTTKVGTLADRYLEDLEAALGGPAHQPPAGDPGRGRRAHRRRPRRPRHRDRSRRPRETSLLEVVLFVLPFLLPVATAIYLAIRLRTITGELEQRSAEPR